MIKFAITTRFRSNFFRLCVSFCLLRTWPYAWAAIQWPLSTSGNAIQSNGNSPQPTDDTLWAQPTIHTFIHPSIQSNSNKPNYIQHASSRMTVAVIKPVMLVCEPTRPPFVFVVFIVAMAIIVATDNGPKLKDIPNSIPKGSNQIPN